MNESNGAGNFLALFRSLWRLIRGDDGRWRKVRWLFSLRLQSAKVSALLPVAV